MHLITYIHILRIIGCRSVVVDRNRSIVPLRARPGIFNQYTLIGLQPTNQARKSKIYLLTQIANIPRDHENGDRKYSRTTSKHCSAQIIAFI